MTPGAGTLSCGENGVVPNSRTRRGARAPGVRLPVRCRAAAAGRSELEAEMSCRRGRGTAMRLSWHCERAAGPATRSIGHTLARRAVVPRAHGSPRGCGWWRAGGDVACDGSLKAGRRCARSWGASSRRAPQSTVSIVPASRSPRSRVVPRGLPASRAGQLLSATGDGVHLSRAGAAGMALAAGCATAEAEAGRHCGVPRSRSDAALRQERGAAAVACRGGAGWRWSHAPRLASRCAGEPRSPLHHAQGHALAAAEQPAVPCSHLSNLSRQLHFAH
jgi:hypothetical protein